MLARHGIWPSPSQSILLWTTRFHAGRTTQLTQELITPRERGPIASAKVHPYQLSTTVITWERAVSRYHVLFHVTWSLTNITWLRSEKFANMEQGYYLLGRWCGPIFSRRSRWSLSFSSRTVWLQLVLRL